MGEDPISKILLYGELASGNRKVEGYELLYKDVIKCHLKRMDINVQSWEDIAVDRSTWRRLHSNKDIIGNTTLTCTPVLILEDSFILMIK